MAFVDIEHEVTDGAVCVFSARGVPPEVQAAAHLQVIDAACPLVANVHAQDVDAAPVADGGQVAYLTQTTLVVDDTAEIVAGAIDPSFVDGGRIVGVSSAASTPEELVDQLVAWLQARGFSDPEEVEVALEDVAVSLPAGLD